MNLFKIDTIVQELDILIILTECKRDDFKDKFSRKYNNIIKVLIILNRLRIVYLEARKENDIIITRACNNQIRDLDRDQIMRLNGLNLYCERIYQHNLYEENEKLEQEVLNLEVKKILKDDNRI